MPLIELTINPISEAFPEDLAINEVFSLTSKAKGLNSVYFDVKTQPGDLRIYYLISVWSASEDYESFSKSPECEEIRKLLTPYIAGQVKRHVVEFNADTSIAFTSPVTEIAILTLREGSLFEDLESAQKKLAKDLEGLKASRLPITWGTSRGESNTIIFIAGWDTIEAFRAAISIDIIRNAVRGIQAHGTASINLTNLKRHY